MQHISNPIKVIDSHTAGEPTRVVIEGGPDLGQGKLNERLGVFESKFDQFRRTVILEPRGYEAMVGALLCTPDDPACETAILFFNNHGFLKMCGHGTIGVAATLAYLNRMSPGSGKFQTPAGIIQVVLHDQHQVSFTNVPSYVLQREVVVNAGEYGQVVGDIAFGGNWFFIVRPPVELVKENREELLRLARIVLAELETLELVGLESCCVDHVQFYLPDEGSRSSRNFVVCPGGEFDRSPCGTGTSAIIASLADRGVLSEGDVWTQESLTGGTFSGKFCWDEGRPGAVIPTITGSAYVCAESSLVQHQDDPYRFGNMIKVDL
ncbi:proline racemase family protein [bacterium]|nr:proline racemase family protein [bacterium]